MFVYFVICQYLVNSDFLTNFGCITWHYFINFSSGRGVFTCTPIEKGSFVVEYRGELISQYEQDKRQKKYTEKQNAFLFDFELNNVTWW